MPIDELIPLPPDDPDAELARRIEKGGPLSNENPFEGALATFVARAREVSPPAGLSARLWLRVAPERLPLLRLLPSWARWAGAAAAVVLVALGSWLAYDSRPTLISSAGDAVAVATFDDASTVTLRPHTTLYEVSRDRYLLSGEAFFDVTHNPGRVVRIRTGLGEVRVLGTRFNVSTWGDQTSVFLQRGSVVFTHLLTGAIDTLSPGDELLARRAGQTVRVAWRGGEGSLDWMSDVLVFGERPLSRILAEMEHHFDINVFVPDSLKPETLSGRIFLSNPSQSLNDLGVALGGRFEQGPQNMFRLVLE